MLGFNYPFQYYFNFFFFYFMRSTAHYEHNSFAFLPSDVDSPNFFSCSELFLSLLSLSLSLPLMHVRLPNTISLSVYVFMAWLADGFFQVELIKQALATGIQPFVQFAELFTLFSDLKMVIWTPSIMTTLQHSSLTTTCIVIAALLCLLLLLPPASSFHQQLARVSLSWICISDLLYPLQ